MKSYFYWSLGRSIMLIIWSISALSQAFLLNYRLILNNWFGRCSFVKWLVYYFKNLRLLFWFTKSEHSFQYPMRLIWYISPCSYYFLHSIVYKVVSYWSGDFNVLWCCINMKRKTVQGFPDYWTSMNIEYRYARFTTFKEFYILFGMWCD